MRLFRFSAAAFILSCVLHLLMAGGFTLSGFVFDSEDPQPIPGQQSEEEVLPIDATVLDSDQVEAEMAAIIADDKRKKEAEAQRISELESQAEKARKNREAEEQKIAQMRADNRAEQERLEEENMVAMADIAAKRAEQRMKLLRQQEAAEKLNAEQQAETKRLKALEQQRQAEEKRTAEAAERRKLEEQKTAAAEAKRIEDERRATAAAEQRKAEEKREAEAVAKRLAEEKRAQAAEAKRIADQQAAAEAAKKLEQAKAAAAEAKRLEAKRIADEAEAKRVAEEKRIADEKAQAILVAKREADLKAQRKAEEAERRRIQDEERRRQELMAAFAREESSQNARDLDIYRAVIGQKVNRNWIKPAGEKAVKCVLRVKQIPGGDVVDVQTLPGKCGGSVQYQNSVIKAVEKSSPLPEPSNPDVFDRVLEFTFNPDV